MIQYKKLPKSHVVPAPVSAKVALDLPYMSICTYTHSLPTVQIKSLSTTFCVLMTINEYYRIEDGKELTVRCQID
jgi:hypothetical protein